jgi:hypothetical protein
VLTHGAVVVVRLGHVPQHDVRRLLRRRKIQSAFHRTASLDARKVHVETAGSVAILRGTVRSWAEHEDVERAAWSVPGVTAVRNELDIVVQELAEV